MKMNVLSTLETSDFTLSKKNLGPSRVIIYQGKKVVHVIVCSDLVRPPNIKMNQIKTSIRSISAMFKRKSWLPGHRAYIIMA